METHGIHPAADRKAISCSDCGHVYHIAQGQRSGACLACGNIEFFGDENAASARLGLRALSEEIAARRVMPRLLENAKPVDPLDGFRASPDGNEVEAIRVKYQVEWQLWSTLVKNFGNHAHHMAYVTSAVAAGETEKACARYREHRSVMALLPDSRWQADVSDLMLTRLEAIMLARMPSHRAPSPIFDLPDYVKMLPFDSRVTKLMWLALGMMVFLKLLRIQVGPF